MVSLFLCFVFIIMRFLSFEALKSCFYLCMCVLSLVFMFSLGNFELGGYFIVLIFFSGLLGLMVYYCSFSILFRKFNLFFFFLFYSMLCSACFISILCEDIFLLEDFKFIYEEENIMVLLWLIMVLLMLLLFLRYSFIVKGCLRSL